jgi:hypothetical protein
MAEEKRDEPSFGEEFSAAFRGMISKAGFASITPGEIPQGRDVLAAIGGVRGLLEAALPSFAFLVVFSVTEIVLDLPESLVWSVSTPVVLCLIFIIIRAARREPLRSAIGGTVVAAITAFIAIRSGRAADNFLFGIIINIGGFLVMLVSIVVRRPLVALIAGVLSGDLMGWQADAAKRRVLTIATWLWVGLFGIRLAVEVPLYLANEAIGLAIAKLILGLPFYALLLWITWLLVGSVFSTATRPKNDLAP